MSLVIEYMTKEGLIDFAVYSVDVSTSIVVVLS